MIKFARTLALGAVLAMTPGCSTVAGTLFSPITGGVDLNVQTNQQVWILWIPVFVCGAVAGPFVAVYNGVNHDASIFKSFDQYWYKFDQVFRPFEMVGV